MRLSVERLAFGYPGRRVGEDVSFTFFVKPGRPYKGRLKVDVIRYGTKGKPGDWWKPIVFRIGETSSSELEVDLEKRRVTVRGEEVQLTPTEYELLRLLVTHAGKVLTHGQILRQIWGIAYLEQPHVLRVNISNLRRKLEEEPSRPRHIVTEPGVGYRLRTDY